MGRHVIGGNPPIEVTLRRSTRARRLSLRVSRLDGRVTLTLPHRVSEREGIAFVREREDWLRGHLSGITKETRPQIGGTVPFGGEDLAIVAGPVKRARMGEAALIVPDDPARVSARVEAYMKLHARDRLADASDRYAAVLGRSYGRITLRDTRSRWGSCSSTGDLMYSWRLIMAPPEVLDYVAAHEVAHLVEMNHSDAFWTVVGDIFPDHKRCRRWLRENGDRLHRVRFRD
ncbi:M48 family metallopeptidase [Octadecabacter sp. SW4]|uniref:M48 family metallopeptidase n=1 Tax=Octadecabacter sp. SW4 TaxID=2602067 RepID=UPI0011C1D913|nr:SprT family zinc-dependent metalloprotease [Octadecabacter sp. SW4]QEE34753.1 M48 family metallopeptidase [Octadecabacter sp. SW4]